MMFIIVINYIYILILGIDAFDNLSNNFNYFNAINVSNNEELFIIKMT